MIQHCENCKRTYPNESDRWYEVLGTERGGGAVGEMNDFPKPSPVKLCSECFDKLNDNEKIRWRILN